jgi:hypothetical protein
LTARDGALNGNIRRALISPPAVVAGRNATLVRVELRQRPRQRGPHRRQVTCERNRDVSQRLAESRFGRRRSSTDCMNSIDGDADASSIVATIRK